MRAMPESYAAGGFVWRLCTGASDDLYDAGSVSRLSLEALGFRERRFGWVLGAEVDAHVEVPTAY